MARLGDLCRFINGDRGKNYPSQAEISSDGDVPFINAGHLVDGKLDFSDMNYISEEKYNQLNSGKIQENDVLYCLRGSLGKKAIIKGISKGAIASSLVIIRPEARLINSDYLFYALESPTVQEQMMQANNGSSQPNLSAKSVSDYTFNLPTINKQCEIVLKLAKVNDLISLRKEQFAKLDELVKARFVELFGDGSYPQIPLIQLIVEGAGLSYGIIVPGDNVEDGVPMVRPSDFNNGELCLDNVYRVAPEIEAKYTRTRLLGNEILVQVIGQPGQIMLSDSRCKGMNVTRNLAVVRPDCNRINRIYLKTYMQSQEAQAFMLGETKQSTLKQLPLSRLKELEIPVPPMKLQEQFAAFVEQTDKSKLAIQQSLDKLELLKKTLMQEYFG